jgi:hypothetical protein
MQSNYNRPSVDRLTDPLSANAFKAEDTPTPSRAHGARRMVVMGSEFVYPSSFQAPNSRLTTTSWPR